MLALAAIPLIGAVGAAVDYSRANSARTAMQAALDVTALMLSKDAQTLSTEQLGPKATDLFQRAVQPPGSLQRPDHPAAQRAAAGQLQPDGVRHATISTMFWRLMGQENVNITASGEVVWGIKKLNLALALDNTGSMASNGKMTALKEAAHNLLATLKNAEKTPGDIKISIVPFAVDVNVGTTNVDASWIHWDHWDSENGTCSNSNYTSYKQLHRPQQDLDAETTTVTWNGCVKDRDQNNDVITRPRPATAARPSTAPIRPPPVRPR